MDKNKLLKLVEVKYSIRKVCGNCIHSQFSGEDDWGECQEHRYHHIKHDVSKGISIHRFGLCDQYGCQSMFRNKLGVYYGRYLEN